MSGQFIVGMSGAVDLDLMALVWIMERLGVEQDEQLEISRDVRYFASLVIAEINRESKRNK